MRSFNFSLIILLLLTKFDVGDAHTGMKNNSTTVPTLCKFINDINRSQPNPLVKNLILQDVLKAMAFWSARCIILNINYKLIILKKILKIKSINSWAFLNVYPIIYIIYFFYVLWYHIIAIFQIYMGIIVYVQNDIKIIWSSYTLYVYSRIPTYMLTAVFVSRKFRRHGYR